MSTRLTTIFACLGLLLALGACKSELDNKPAAKVSESQPTPKADAKKDGAATDAKKDAAKKDGAADAKKAPAAGAAWKADTTKGSIGFVGAKVTGDHGGTFKTWTGSMQVAEGKPTGLKFEVDVASVDTPDSAKLASHLKSPDFFDVAKHPKATFESTEVKEGGEGGTHTVTGNLQLRGTTKSISFPMTIALKDAAATAKTEFKINRKDFKIEYPGKPDDLIKDEVLLKADFTFAK